MTALYTFVLITWVIQIFLTISSGSTFTQIAWGFGRLTRTYYVPELNGYYYLVLIANSENKFQEQHEMNNLFYTAINPKYFEYGYNSKGSQQTNYELNVIDSLRFCNDVKASW